MKEKTQPGNKDADGLKCKACGCRDLQVTHTTKGNGYIMRQRRCRHCGRTFKSFESL